MHSDAYYSEHCLPTSNDYDPEGCGFVPAEREPNTLTKVWIAAIAIIALVAVCWPAVPFNGH